ncbi:MAG: hypothetical protein AB7V32_09850 [Candidatus Berkiella sp.]
MPILSLEELDEILKHYSAQDPYFLPEKVDKLSAPRSTVVPLLIDNHEHQLEQVNTLGPKALDFIKHAVQHYQRGAFSPPISKEKIAQIYDLLLPLNLDLTGYDNGTAFEKQQATHWEKHWCELMKTINDEGHQLTTDELKKVKNDILCAYRFKIIQHCAFKSKGSNTDPLDDVRTQEYLSLINQYICVLTPTEAFEHIHQKLTSEFENDLGLDLQVLTRYLNIKQQTQFLKKFDEIISRKTTQCLGDVATSKLFEHITKDKELLMQLPSLLEKGTAFNYFIKEFPDKVKRDQLLCASLYQILSTKTKNTQPTLQKHVQILQGMLQSKCLNRP